VATDQGGFVRARELPHPRRRSESGAVAVEFALILPILLILALGIIQYGMYFYARQGGSDVARDAARRAAVGTPSTCAAFRTMVRNNIDSLTGSGTTATVTRTYTKSNPTLVQVGDTVTVKVSFTSYDLNVPLVPMVQDSRVEYVPTQPQACT
jgi:Flp pilus assembly protein TadG